MALNQYNTAEGGTNGTTVTLGNSGGASGTALAAVTPGTGTITFDSTVAHTGSYSYNLTAGTGSNCFIGYGMSSATVMTSRVYIYFTGWPTTSTQLIRFFANTGGLMGNIFCQGSTGKFGVQDNTGTINQTTTLGILNTWLRFELTVAAGATTTSGYIRANIYIGDSTSQLLYSYVNTACNTTTSTASVYSVGKISNSGNWATMYVDDLLVQDNLNMLGPTSTAGANWLTC